MRLQNLVGPATVVTSSSRVALRVGCLAILGVTTLAGVTACETKSTPPAQVKPAANATPAPGANFRDTSGAGNATGGGGLGQNTPAAPAAAPKKDEAKPK